MYSLSGLSSSPASLFTRDSNILIQLLYCCKNSLYCLPAAVAFCCALFAGLILINGYFFNYASCSSKNTTSSIIGNTICFADSSRSKNTFCNSSFLLITITNFLHLGKTISKNLKNLLSATLLIPFQSPSTL